MHLDDSSDEGERKKDSRSKKRNLNRNQKLRAAEEEIKKLKMNPSQSSRSPPPQKRSRSPKAPKERKETVPARECQDLRALKPEPKVGRQCRFWDSSTGCGNPDCSWSQKCLLCGGAHRWIDRHAKRH